MKLEEYRQVYDKISLSQEADERILQALQETQGAGKKWSGKRAGAVRIAAAAVLIVLAVGIMKFPAVAATTKVLVSRFTNLVLEPDKSAQEKLETRIEEGEDKESGYPTSEYAYNDSGVYLEMNAENLDINADVSKKDCKMDSMDAVSKELGIKLLQSKDAYEAKNCIRYTPDVSDSGVLNGVVLTDDFYALGDVRDVECSISPKVEESNSIAYRPGEKYQSPIKMEITIRTDDSDGEDDENQGMDYGGRVKVREEGNENETVEIYEIQNLDSVSAVLTVGEADSVSAWRNLEGEEVRSCVSAFFQYQGIVYRYVGAVSMETMKEFLEGLEIPE